MNKNNPFLHRPLIALKRVFRAAFLLGLLTQVAAVNAQDITFPLNNGFSAIVRGAGPTVCGPSAAASAGNLLYRFYPVDPSTINSTSLGINLYSNNELGYHIAEAGVSKQIIIDIPNAGGLGLNHTLQYNFGQFDGSPTNPQYSTGQYISPQGGSSFGTIRHTINLNFPLGIRKGYLAFKVQDGDITSPWPPHMCVIPFIVEGPITTEVPVLGTTTQPQMPYMVLHAPPGDGSSSAFRESTTTCRTLTQTVQDKISNSANLAVKIGTKGSIGFIATIDFEFSVTFSGGVTAEDMSITTSTDKTCVSVSEGFKTTELTGPEGGGDVFIGYGTNMEYGVYPYLVADRDSCVIRVDTGLVFVPVGEPTKFAYTKTAILSDIQRLEAIVADSANVGARVANDAQNQIDVWQQTLAMNDANINNPDNDSLGNINFSAGVGSFNETGISVTETNSLQVEHFLEGRVGVQSVVSIGGSGVSGGYEFKSSRRYGATESQSGQDTKVIRYDLNDNDGGDIFNLQVVRDPMFGTPIFRIQSGTKSSCPYQGGYQRDQPKMTFTNQTADSIELSGVPLGTSASFTLDLCNESNEPREYTLKLNPETNLNGAVVTAAGLPLNNAFGQSFQVPAGGCLSNPLVIEVKRQSENSPMEYPDLELFLEPSCQEKSGIRSSLYASVTFGTNTSVQDMANGAAALKLYPNPAANRVTVSYHAAQSQLTQFEVYDLQGRLLKRDHAQLPVGDVQHQLDVAELPNGMYLIKVKGEAFHLDQKMVIRR